MEIVEIISALNLALRVEMARCDPQLAQVGVDLGRIEDFLYDWSQIGLADSHKLQLVMERAEDRVSTLVGKPVFWEDINSELRDYERGVDERAMQRHEDKKILQENWEKYKGGLARLAQKNDGSN